MSGVHEWLHPSTNTEWALLRTLSVGDLTALGLRAWSEPNDLVPGKTLMLFPSAWYAHIPLDFKLTDINGNASRFNANTHSADQRLGYLVYGVLV